MKTPLAWSLFCCFFSSTDVRLYCEKAPFLLTRCLALTSHWKEKSYRAFVVGSAVNVALHHPRMTPFRVRQEIRAVRDTGGHRGDVWFMIQALKILFNPICGPIVKQRITSVEILNSCTLHNVLMSSDQSYSWTVWVSSLRSIRTKTSRHKNSFFPSASVSCKQVQRSTLPPEQYALHQCTHLHIKIYVASLYIYFFVFVIIYVYIYI